MKDVLKRWQHTRLELCDTKAMLQCSPSAVTYLMGETVDVLPLSDKNMKLILALQNVCKWWFSILLDSSHSHHFFICAIPESVSCCCKINGKLLHIQVQDKTKNILFNSDLRKWKTVVVKYFDDYLEKCKSWKCHPTKNMTQTTPRLIVETVVCFRCFIVVLLNIKTSGWHCAELMYAYYQCHLDLLSFDGKFPFHIREKISLTKTYQRLIHGKILCHESGNKEIITMSKLITMIWAF